MESVFSLPFADRLANPTLELRDSSGNLIDSNDNWRTGEGSGNHRHHDSTDERL